MFIFKGSCVHGHVVKDISSTLHFFKCYFPSSNFLFCVCILQPQLFIEERSFCIHKSNVDHLFLKRVL